jgi:hypothetical protein
MAECFFVVRIMLMASLASIGIASVCDMASLPITIMVMVLIALLPLIVTFYVGTYATIALFARGDSRKAASMLLLVLLHHIICFGAIDYFEIDD